jgi:ATP-dependent Clp protease ATP-binding subunit ClpA
VRDTLFIVTTNAGGSALAQQPADSLTESELRSLCLAELEKAGFAPELLNRMDAIIPMTPLANEDVARLAANLIIAHLEENGLALSDGEIAISLFLQLIDEYENMGQRVSARDLIRSIRQALDDGIIAAKKHDARTVRIADRHGSIVVEPILTPTLT